MKIIERFKQKALTHVGPLVTRLGKVRAAFTLSTFACCAAHWLTSHNASVYVFAAALIFGGLVATAVAWKSQQFSRP